IQVRSTETPAEMHRGLRPVTTALWEQTEALNRAARDPDPGVRLAALRALEVMGEIRRRWYHPEEFIEPDRLAPAGDGKPAKPLKGDKAAAEEGGLSLTLAGEQAAPKEDAAALSAAIPAMVRDLGDSQPRVRLAAIDALEMATGHGRDKTA